MWVLSNLELLLCQQTLLIMWQFLLREACTECKYVCCLLLKIVDIKQDLIWWRHLKRLAPKTCSFHHWQLNYSVRHIGSILRHVNGTRRSLRWIIISSLSSFRIVANFFVFADRPSLKPSKRHGHWSVSTGRQDIAIVPQSPPLIALPH